MSIRVIVWDRKTKKQLKITMFKNKVTLSLYKIANPFKKVKISENH